MKPARRARPSSADFLNDGKNAFLAGRFYLAAEAFAKAQAADPRNPVVLFNLASAKERIGEIDEAAQLLTSALRYRSSWFEPAQRLALLLGRYRIKRAGDLDPHGLLAAFAFNRIDRQPIAAAAIAHLQAHPSHGAAIEKVMAGNAEDVARDLVLRRTDKLLSHPLFLAALTSNPIHNSGWERLLTAIRRIVVLEAGAERFEDKAFTGFVLAFIQQCIANEHIFAVSPQEAQHLATIPIDHAALLAGAPDQSRRLMLHLLYDRPDRVIGEAVGTDECRAIKPRALGALLASWFEDEARLTSLAADISSAGTIVDPTSRRVADQYEAHPYPRWSDLQMPREGGARISLEPFFNAEKLSFFDRPFKVLIAGAGTGQHALAAAIRYGPKAEILAVDLSCRSLAYGKARAAQFGITNIRFAQADIQTMTSEAGPFDVIEAVGVLHHMAEPFKGWARLIELLRPGGLMLTGLYSAIARRNIAELRSEANYPGPKCSDDAARAYRARLMTRTDDTAAILLDSHDFYTLSEFRDLVLHEHERPIFLSEVEVFLEQHGLAFRGFQLPGPLAHAFLKSIPGEAWPGRLSDWSVFEESHPRTFDAMYRIWCEKVG